MIGLDPDRLVFIDETWAKTNFTRLPGRCPRGKRLVAKVPHGHWKTTTFVAALRSTGLTAPTVIDGAIDGAYSARMCNNSSCRRCVLTTLW